MDRIETALAAVNACRSAAARWTDPTSSPELADLAHARCRPASGVAEVRQAAEVASGEWGGRVLPEERIAVAEHQSRRMPVLLAASLVAGRPSAQG
ncbi:hypothetical protein [Streptomyces sp. NPDC054794]